MRRLIILALMSLVCTVPAAAELAQRLAKPAVAQGEVVAALKTGPAAKRQPKPRSRSKNKSESTCQRGSLRYRNGRDIVRGSRQC
jgi:hypothetical protein